MKTAKKSSILRAGKTLHFRQIRSCSRTSRQYVGSYYRGVQIEAKEELKARIGRSPIAVKL